MNDQPSNPSQGSSSTVPVWKCQGGQRTTDKFSSCHVAILWLPSWKLYNHSLLFYTDYLKTKQNLVIVWFQLRSGSICVIIFPSLSVFLYWISQENQVRTCNFSQVIVIICSIRSTFYPNKVIQILPHQILTQK